MLKELTETGTIPGLGFQVKWAKYFRRRYLFTEEVNGVVLYNAIWRNGADRPQPRASDNLAESFHAKTKAKLKSISKDLVGEVSGNQRPSFPELIKRLELTIELDAALNTRRQEDVLNRIPTDVDRNLVTGHRSIQRHSNRLSARDIVEAVGKDSSYVQKVDKAPYTYYVMPCANNDDDKDEKLNKPTTEIAK